MIAATPGRRRRLLALRSLVALLACLLPPALVPPDRAEAAAPVAVVLTDATASGPGATDTISVAGSVTNPGSTPLYHVRAQLWRSTAALRTHEALDEAVTGAGVPAGRTMSTSGAVADLGTTALAPGERRTFSFRATRAELGITAGDATYWVGASVRTQASPNGAIVTTEARTLVTMPGATPVVVAGVVELASVPRQVKPNLLIDDGLADELAGRLRVLLDAAAQPGTSRVVDPALVAEVTDMADGYRVVDGTDSRPGTGREVAAQWLADLQALPTASGYRSLFARPELTAARALDGTPLVDRLLAASTATSAVPLPTLATLDEVDTPTLTALERLDAPVLTLDAAVTRPWVRVGRTPLVSAVDPSRALGGRALADTPLNRAAVLEAYARAAGSQVRLLRTEADVAADRDATPPWVTRGVLSVVTASDPVAWSRQLPAGKAGQVIGPGDATRLADLAEGLRGYAAAATASGVGDLVDAQVARAASQSWAGDAAGREAWLATVDQRAGAAALARGVTLSALPRFTMSSADNEFPVTVTNALPDDVVVRVVASTDAPQRIRVESSAEVTVRTGQSAGVVLRAVAAGNGVANAQLHVETPGALRLTPDVAVVVEATNLGTLGWAIVLVSGVVLVVSTALRIRQVRARNRGSAHVR